MHFIYANATSVIVWLGEEGDGSSKALRLLEHISFGPEFENGSIEKLHEMADPLKDCLQTLLARPWFERVWVYNCPLLQPILFILTISGRPRSRCRTIYIHPLRWS
jgi:hypothetical protein